MPDSIPSSPRLPHLPKYRHYKPKDLGVVRIDGRDYYLGRYNSPESREKYNRVIAEWLTTRVTPVPEGRQDAVDGLGRSVRAVFL